MEASRVTSRIAWRQGIGAAGLLAANAAMLWIVLVFEITPFQLVLVFWCECVWVGVFSAIKLLLAAAIGNPFENRFAEVSRGAAVFSALFFIVAVSSLFFSVLGALLLAILFAGEGLALSGESDQLLNQFGLVIGFSIVLAAGHALSLVVNFLLLGEFRAARFGELAAQPFRRCGALLVAIAVSLTVMAVYPAWATTGGFGVLVLVMKVVLDLRLHSAERRRFESTSARFTQQVSA